MAQCEASGITPGRDNFGKQCRRNAVNGAKFCVMHGGNLGVERVRKDGHGVQCSRTKKDGERCKNFAAPGTTVCRKHGANTPSVQNRAKERLLAIVEPALVELTRIVSKADTSDADRLRAITLVLDRTGYNAKSELGVEVAIKPWETTLQGIIRTPLPGTQQDLPEIVLDALERDSAPWDGWSDDEDDEPEDLPPRTTGSANPPASMRW